MQFDQQAISAIAHAKRVFVFTGAGISKESGLPTFRDLSGLWTKYDPMTLATPEAFQSDPAKVWSMYAQRQKELLNAQPNPGHITLAEMEPNYEQFLICTQNVDDLHERAGSKSIAKLHGDLRRMRCVECSARYDIPSADLPEEFTVETLPKCDRCSGICRPDIVWFGEMLPPEPLEKSFLAAGTCDLMMIVGTSGEVSGGYGFTELAVRAGAYVVEINPNESHLSRLADYAVRAPSGEVLLALWDQVRPLRGQ